MSSDLLLDDPRLSAASRVLLVDDNPANIKALEALLDRPGLQLLSAGSGPDALKQLLDHDVAAILMDVHMPGMDGFQTTELIRQRERTAHVPIIFITAVNLDAASMKRAYALGALDYMTKPFDGDVLRAKVQALTESYRQADIIARQAAALRAQEAANRAKDEFLSTLSHELRAPLNAILGWSALLEVEPGLPPKLQKAVATISRNARAQGRLVDELVELSHLAMGKLKLHEQALDLDTVVQAALSATAAAALQHGVRVELDVAPVAYRTRGDAQRLEQSLVSLLSNAIKFSQAGQQVLVELHRRGDRFEIRVKDTGIGITPEQLPHIFERFYQADGSRTRAYGGLGIGLTLARRLVELHGGTLEAFSAGRGSGATFVLSVPARAPEASDATPPRVAMERLARLPPVADAQPLLGRRVLIVDDDEDTRELLAVVLGDAGARTATAAAAAPALAAFVAQPFDVVVSDLGMPGEDGLSLIRKLRAHEASLGVGVGAGGAAALAVAVSGYAAVEDTLAAGFQAHLTKPCEPSQLIALIAKLRPASG